MQELYANDTFFHLSTLERVGLVLLSIVLAMVTVAVFWKLTSSFKLVFKLLAAIFFIWIFIWISPQVYYLYYIQIIDGLPLQNVIQWPPSPLEVFQTVTFSGKSNLSNHGKGLIFWAMMIIALKPKANTLVE